MQTTEEQQEAELRELEAKYPPPRKRTIYADWAWLADQSLSPTWSHWGTNVAVLDKRIIGVGPDYIDLRLRLAREYNVNPNRIVVVYFETLH